MAAALSEDFCRAGHDVRVVAHPDFHLPFPNAQAVPASAADLRGQLRWLASDADRIVVIAPETGGALDEVNCWLGSHSERLLTPSGPAVCLGSSKHATAQALERAGIQRPYGTRIDLPANWRPSPPAPGPLHGEGPSSGTLHILKPDDGAGSEDMFLMDGHAQCQTLASQVSDTRTPSRSWRMEALLRGTSASVIAICGPAESLLLPATRQRFSGDESLESPGPAAAAEHRSGFLTWPGSWTGFDYPLPPDLELRASVLVRRALGVLPRFSGPAGFDLVLSGTDPQEDRIVDFNPRLTTSWAGLRELVDGNLAELLLRIHAGQTVQPPATRSSAFQWRLPTPETAGRAAR